MGVKHTYHPKLELVENVDGKQVLIIRDGSGAKMFDGFVTAAEVTTEENGEKKARLYAVHFD